MIPKEILNEYQAIKKTFERACIYYNASTDSYFVAITDQFKCSSYLIKKITMTAIEILEALKAYKTVSRWDCLRHKSELRELLKKPQYFYLDLEIELLIEQAQESL